MYVVFTIFVVTNQNNHIMKRALLCSLAILAFVNLSQAQITTSHAKQKPVEATKVPFDSTKNWLGNENVTSYIGQLLYVNGKSEKLSEYGYSNFKNEKEPSKWDDRWGQPAKSSHYNTKYEDLYGKYFLVVDVQPDSKQKSDYFKENAWWFKLQNRDNPDEVVWFEYDGKFELEFPFITVSYFNFIKNSIVGDKYVFKYSIDEGKFSTFLDSEDFYTGDTISQTKDDRWECIDITIEDKYFNLVAVLKNQRGNVSIMDVKYLLPADGTKHAFKESIYKALVNKYGAGNMDTVRQSKIKVGMPKALLLLSWGEPDDINRSSHGPDQWVYGYQYVYLQNGIITAWN